jgi:ParB family chromosome partitioning protein
VTTMKIADIRIGRRYRKDPGDIEALAKSIQELGLLQPIVVNASNSELIAGMRRLEACKLLGWEEVPVRLINLDEALNER